MHKGLKRHPRGMTLIEIMVVIAILGMMAATIAYSVVSHLVTAKEERARLDCKQLEGGLEMYFSRYGRYPERAAGLEILVQRRIIKALTPDPWGNAYIVRWDDDNPIVISYGADGQPGGEGPNADISSR